MLGRGKEKVQDRADWNELREEADERSEYKNKEYKGMKGGQGRRVLMRGKMMGREERERG
jgi:hypothetical protein